MLLAQTKHSIECHLAVDTGMHRLGVAPDLETVTGLYALPSLKITGIFSHLGSSDQPDTTVSCGHKPKSLVLMICWLAYPLEISSMD